MGLKALLVDKSSQLGGNWTQRYDTVTLHTASYSDHYPFLKFPENWPTWVRRDKITDWMNHYAQIMGLNIMLNAVVKSIEYDQAERRYRIQIDGQPTLTARHVVCATGVVTDLPKAPEFRSQDSFTGQIYHSTAHKSASQITNLGNKRVAIIGVGTSAHDIAQDFVNCGAKAVTMIQRGPIFSFSSACVEQFFLAPFKDMPTADADLTFNSFPLPVMRALNTGMTHMMSRYDAKMLERLEKAGLAVKKGDDGVPIIDFQVTRFGGYYVDQGASEMIAEGRIKIQRCEEGIKEFSSQGIVLANETKVEADVIILATGVQFGTVNVERVMGKDFFDKLGGLSSWDKEFERRGVSDTCL